MGKKLNNLPRIRPKDLKQYEVYYFKRSKELSTGRIRAKFKLLYSLFDFGSHNLHIFLPLTSQEHVLGRDEGEIVTLCDKDYEHVDGYFRSTLLGGGNSLINMNDIDPLKRNQIPSQGPCHYAARLSQAFCESSTLRKMDNWRRCKKVRTELDFAKKQLASCTIKVKQGEITNSEVDRLLTSLGL